LATTTTADVEVRMEIIEQLVAERERAQKVVDACNAAIAAFRALSTGEPRPGKQRAVTTGDGGSVLNRDESRFSQIKMLLAQSGPFNPLSTREIAERLGQPRLIVKQALQRLKKSGNLTAVGDGNGRKWALPAS
jgi:biotin operon repressor